MKFGDESEVVAEAIDCCPVDCIHAVSFAELRQLEKHRQGMLDSGAMAYVQGASKLAARAEGRGSSPNWRAPLAGVELDTSGLEASEAEDAVPPPPGRELDAETLSSLYPKEDV